MKKRDQGGFECDFSRCHLDTATQIARDDARAVVDAVYRSDSRVVFATLIRLLGGFDLAEEAL